MVNRSGLLTGKHHFSTPSMMQELLEADGVTVKNDKVQNLKEVYWDPMIELSL